MSKKIDLKRIIKQVLDFVRGVEQKLPAIIVKAADFGLKYVAIAETFLTSQQVLDFDKLVPQAEPFRVEIVAVLTELEIAFKAVEGPFKKGALMTAAGQIGLLQAPGVPVGHIILAAQAKWVESNPTHQA